MVKNTGRCREALLIATVASMHDNFNRSNVQILQGLGYRVTLAANFKSKEDTSPPDKIRGFVKEMHAMGVGTVQVDFARKPARLRDVLRPVCQVARLLERGFALVHCHAPACAAITRAVFQKYRRKHGAKLVYTAHGFHFYKGAPLKNWLLYYPVEKCLSRWTDVLVTVNREDYARALKKMKAKKTVYVPGVGVDTEKFSSGRAGRVREELGLREGDTVLLSAGELNKNKNHIKAIEAVAQVKQRDAGFFEGLHYFIAGRGPGKAALCQAAKKYGVAGHVHLLGYREDIASLMMAADIYVLPSLREGLNVSLMEAMASGLPCICGDIRGNRDLIQDGEGGYLFQPDDAVQLAERICRLKEEKRRMHMGLHNLKKIRRFGKDAVNMKMKACYMGLESERQWGHFK